MQIDLILIILSILFTIGIEEVYKVKKNENEKQVIPKLSPAELKYNSKGVVNERDLTSIIIQLGQKKYLKIVADNEIKIIKLRKYKEKNKSEELMYKALFKKGNVVKVNELHKNLYKDISEIVHAIDNKELRKSINEQEDITLNNSLVLLTLIIFFIINIHLPYNKFKIIAITIMTWASFISLIRVYTTKNSKRSKILVSILSILVGLPFYMMSVSKIMNNLNNIAIFILGHIGVFFIIKSLNLLTPKTKTGLELKTEAENFNNYLINITKEEISKKLKENPNFLEIAFPYAYAFNHTFKWRILLKKYDKKLKWFEGNEFELTECLIKIKNQIVKSGHKED